MNTSEVTKIIIVRDDNESGERLDIHLEIPASPNGQLALPGIPDPRREILPIEDVHPSQQTLLRDAFTGIFSAYNEVFAEFGLDPLEAEAGLYSSEDDEYVDDPDNTIFYKDGRGYFRDLELRIYSS